MRDKLIELLCAFDGIYPSKCSFPTGDCKPCEKLADHLIANGVTLQQWIPVSEGLPAPFISVLVQMPGEEPCPTVREGFLTNNGTWYAGHFKREPSEVTHWLPMPEFHSKEK